MKTWRWLVVVMMMVAGMAHAQTEYTWTNADGANNSWSNAGNWDPSTGTPGGNAGDDAVFDGVAATIGNPSNGTVTFRILNLKTAGWTVGTGQLRIANFHSAGNGVNNVNSILHRGTANATIAPGNTLVIGTIRFDEGANLSTLTMSGGGTVVINNAESRMAPTISGAGTKAYWNAPGTTTHEFRFRNLTVTSGGTIGGTGNIVLGGEGTATSRNLQINASSILAPGGDGGNFGSEFATLSVRTGANAVGGERVNLANNSVFSIKLGTTSGQNSRLSIEHLSTGASGGYLQIGTGVELRLVGPATPPSGTFTIATFNNPTGKMDYGSFATVTYNGALLTPDLNYTISYNENDITLEIPPRGTSIVIM